MKNITKLKRYKLDNGLRVIEDSIPGSKSFTLTAMFKTGSRNETPDIWGISHFLEHMAFKGTKTYPSAYLLAKELDSLGAMYNAFTSKEHTGYYLKGSQKVFDKAISIISEMTSDPIIVDEEVDKERGTIIEELNMYEDDPGRKIYDLFEQSLYAEKQIAQEIVGSKKSLAGIHAKQIKDYREKYYRTGNTVVSMSGFIPTDFRTKVEKHFSRLKEGENKYLSSKIDKKKRINLFYKKTQQTHLALGFPGLGFLDKERYVATVLATLLGGNMSSRMFSEVREKRGLAYYVRTHNDNMLDVGAFATFAGVNNEKTYEAVKIINNVYRSVLDKIPADELTKTKEYMIGMVTLYHEASEYRSEANAVTELYGADQKTLEEKIAIIEKITAEQVQSLAKKLLDENKLCLALIGPHKDEARFEKALGGSNKK